MSKSSWCRNGCNWHIRWTHAKDFLATGATYSLSRNCKSRRTPKLHPNFFGGNSTSLRDKGNKSLELRVPHTQSHSILLGLNCRKFLPTHSFTAARYWASILRAAPAWPGWRCIIKYILLTNDIVPMLLNDFTQKFHVDDKQDWWEAQAQRCPT